MASLSSKGPLAANAFASYISSGEEGGTLTPLP